MIFVELIDLREVLLDFILYIVPGYITLRLHERYGAKKASGNFDRLLCCISYSVIIRLTYPILSWLVSHLNWPLYYWLNGSLQQQFGYLLLSLPFGFIIVQFQKILIKIH